MSRHDDDLIGVGHVLGAWGVKGWVKVFSNTSPRENIVKYSPWLVDRDGELEALKAEGRVQGKNVIARLEGVDDRSGAEQLTGSQLFIRQGQLPGLESGEYYWADLIGLEVETLQGESLGVVSAMMETGADDVMVLSGDRERLIPFVLDEIVAEVNLENKRLVVDWSAEF